MTSIPTSDLNTLLKVNLAEYLSANADSNSDATVYRVRRELAIARLALEEGTKVYLAAIDMIKASLTSIPQEKLPSMLSLLATIEDKSSRVISAAANVAKTAKMGAEIESLLASKLDAAQIYSIVTQLPILLQSILSSMLLNSEVAAQICNSFNEALTEQISVLTYSPLKSGGEEVSSRGVIEAQVVAMLNSVPDDEVVVQERLPSVYNDI